MIGSLLGGIGLFLLGMTLMTSGMQAVAGDRLRGWLQRSTRTPLSGLLAGTGVTALIQSSSATTLAAVGFVGAGLLTFSQSLGLLYGANLGTTSTAWIVSLLGLKVKIDVIALPLVGIGAGLKVFGGKRLGHAGLAIAGFGLIFVGIEVIQEGMAGVAAVLDPGAWARPGVLGTVILLGFGLVMTVVMQSSSAAIATTLAAVHAGTIGLEQAALLAIGQNVGTTVKAVLGAAGGPVAAWRAAVAHILFNVGTGAAALVTLPLFLLGVRWFSDLVGGDDPAVQLAIFHSFFNLLGVAIFLPLTPRFGALVERLVPERRKGLVRRLSDAGAGVPDLRIEAARRTVDDALAEATQVAAGILSGESKGDPARRLSEVREAVLETRRWLAPLRSDPGTAGTWRRHLAILHALDHLDRLVDACDDFEPATRLRRDGALDELRGIVTRLLAPALTGGVDGPGAAGGSMNPSEPPPEGEPGGPAEGPDAHTEALSLELADYRRLHRPRILEQTAAGTLSPLAADERLEAIRWAERVGHHVARARVHLAEAARVRDDDREFPSRGTSPDLSAE